MFLMSYTFLLSYVLNIVYWFLLLVVTYPFLSVKVPGVFLFFMCFGPGIVFVFCPCYVVVGGVIVYVLFFPHVLLFFPYVFVARV